ncbi:MULTISPECIES: hypothetical protein [unclassified Mycolicibacterium]|uniref:hypothetical protein n=1 Tax=unclassified Mycolicibacterium TaxID=2636767 RepID=UPI0013093FCB|nr:MULTISPECIES: hypothetical protein [unclassified Mycolicibacterium]MUL81820.1 hypothetical protein [Mycolicibacterium sp. CBMA 329]MUL87586.1 hypothetical protein [Mycolicibacterium sp. CBMA 331]MUL99550.1 hypothetical protein [Mycolicibacterium sp. CBMA 334]MUM26568.1 hypothetical protein [Mycolicibacterium sp. CBMA 295]MUM37883.1 hypothetical protein [Mycolicibacterium sp. CBMA 247]
MILNWGATDDERAAALPCDALAPGAAIRADRALSINAPSSTVFGWLCQLRVAPYSYDLLDNAGRRSPHTRDPELARLKVGQRFMYIFALRSFAEDEHVTLQSRKVAVTYAVQDRAEGTRLHVRVRFDGSPIVGWALALGDVVMMRKQLLTLRELAEKEAAMITS